MERLGFQGLFPLFTSREDSVRDPRLEDLIDAVSRMFHLYAGLLAATASAGEAELAAKLAKRLERLARWWDQHATYEVADLPRVHGGERAAAAEHVALALAGLRQAQQENPSGSSDLTFWRQRRQGFQSPAAFAQVVDALLRQDDHRAALGLLMTWLSTANETALEEGEASFHALARRWLRDVVDSPAPAAERVPLLVRFIELLEANAEELWGVPEWSLGRPKNDDEPSERFESAYEDVTFHDSADDGSEGAVLGSESPDYFPLEDEAERLEDRLDFLTTVAALWQGAAESAPQAVANPELAETLAGWHATARSWQEPLLALLDGLHELKIPEPAGGFEDVMEYDRRRMLREQLAESIIETCLETGRAVRQLGSMAGAKKAGHSSPGKGDPDWEPLALKLEAELGRGDPAGVRRSVAEVCRKVPHPTAAVRADVGRRPSAADPAVPPGPGDDSRSARTVAAPGTDPRDLSRHQAGPHDGAERRPGRPQNLRVRPSLPDCPAIGPRSPARRRPFLAGQRRGRRRGARGTAAPHYRFVPVALAGAQPDLAVIGAGSTQCRAGMGRPAQFHQALRRRPVHAPIPGLGQLAQHPAPRHRRLARSARKRRRPAEAAR